METVAQLRHFNRYYAAKLAAFSQGLQDNPYSLTEARVLYELAQHSGLSRKEANDRRLSAEGRHADEERRQTHGRRRSAEGARRGVTAGELAARLELDAGYLSRILKRFEADLLLAKTPSAQDKRQSQLQLTSRGRECFRSLEKSSQDQMSDLLEGLSLQQQDELVRAVRTVEALLEKKPSEQWLLRPHRSGDLGWMVEVHARCYAKEYHWGQPFEALVARVVADFLDNYKPGLEGCWLVEQLGQRVGSVMLVEKTPQLAQLRLLWVDPAARRQGLGSMLVKQCEEFARQVGYEKIFLWTQNVLTSARRIYQAAGYRLIEQSTHQLFGEPTKGESWVLDL